METLLYNNNKIIYYDQLRSYKQNNTLSLIQEKIKNKNEMFKK